MIFVIDILVALLSTMLFPTFISDASVGFSNSVFSIFFFLSVTILLIYLRKKKYGRRMWFFTHIIGFVLSFLTACGYSLDVTGEIWFRKIIVSVLLFAHIYASVLTLIWGFLEENESSLYCPSKKFIKIDYLINWVMNRPVVLGLILLLCWLPAYIADFPGGFRYDATKELNQIVNGFDGDFPLLHSAIITHLLPWTYELFGSYNVGVALYIIIQILFLAFIYVHMLTTFYKQSTNKILLLIVTAYCGLFPVIQILVVQEVRDILFSMLLTYTMFWFYLLEADKNEFFKNKSKSILLGVLLSLTILARNNNTGIFTLILIVLLAVLLWLVNRKTNMKGACLLAVSSIGSYIAFSIMLTISCQPIAPASTKSALSIMSQPIIRAYIIENDTWTKEEVEELEKYVNLNGIQYCAENADLTKGRLTIDDNFWDFFRFWCIIGQKHMGCYIDAILANTQNMWFPSSIIDGYNQVYKEEGQPYYGYDKCYYAISGNLESPVVHMNLSPKILDYYTQIGLYISFEKIPVISMLFSIGFNFWLMLNCVFYMVYRKMKRLYLPLMIVFGYTMLSACVPLVLVRYFAAIFLAMPMIIIFTIQPTVSNMSWGILNNKMTSLVETYN